MENMEWKAALPKREVNEKALAVFVGLALGILVSFGLGGM